MSRRRRLDEPERSLVEARILSALAKISECNWAAEPSTVAALSPTPVHEECTIVQTNDLVRHLELPPHPTALEIDLAIGDQVMRQRLDLHPVKAPSGGHHFEGVCKCGRRVRRLYLPPNAQEFACAHCHHLLYFRQKFNTGRAFRGRRSPLVRPLDMDRALVWARYQAIQADVDELKEPAGPDIPPTPFQARVRVKDLVAGVDLPPARVRIECQLPGGILEADLAPAYTPVGGLYFLGVCPCGRKTYVLYVGDQGFTCRTCWDGQSS